MYRTEPKHTRKRILPVACIVALCALLFTGCVARNPWFNNLDTRTFYANIKADASADYGKKAAEYDDRIYYLSAENGTQGVYSMRSDGSDVKLEFAAEDIRALAVKNDGFYNAEFAGVEENENGSYRSFRLYYRAAPDDAPANLLDETDRAEVLRDKNIWDFCFTSDGTLWVRFAEMDWLFGETRLFLFAIQNERIVLLNQYMEAPEEKDFFQETNNPAEFVLYQYGYARIAFNEIYESDEDTFSLGGISVPSLFDAFSGKILLPIDLILQNNWMARLMGEADRWIVRQSGKQVLLASKIGLVWYTGEACDVYEPVVFPATESIYATYDTGGDVLLLTREFRKSGWLREGFRSAFGIDELKGERLYQADPETGELTKILSLKSGEAFLCVDDTRAAAASGKTVLVYDISGAAPELTQTIELEHEIVDCANKVDAAGNWLFLYRFNEETGRDELLEKVDIG